MEYVIGMAPDLVNVIGMRGVWELSNGLANSVWVVVAPVNESGENYIQVNYQNEKNRTINLVENLSVHMVNIVSSGNNIHRLEYLGFSRISTNWRRKL